MYVVFSSRARRQLFLPVKQAKKRECITTYERTEDKMRGTIKGFLIVMFHAKKFFLKLIGGLQLEDFIIIT